MRARRPSRVVIDQERKTEYWRELFEGMESLGKFKLDAQSQTDLTARILMLGLVTDKRTRDPNEKPNPRNVIIGLDKAMMARLTELNNGKPVKMDPKVAPLEKIARMEKAIQVLEARKEKEEEEEAAKVKEKIGELQSTLVETQKKKEEQRETNRRTMQLELSNLRESMAKMQQEQNATTAAAAQSANKEVGEMAAKMNRLEAALRMMNEERKKGVEDKETILLKRKLALFEQKFKDLEAQKTVDAKAQEADGLRDKLLLMEDKLQKMERRKSMSMTMMMKEKMEQVEKQLEMLRAQGGGPAAAAGGGAEVNQKMARLEAELKKLQTTQITPAMVNDEETVALRNHIKKLEGGLLQAEKNMEAQRLRVEQERMKAMEERRKEEAEFREAQRKREQELLKRIQMMEQRLQQSSGGDPALAKRLERMEQNMQTAARGGGDSDPAVAQKLADMERKLQETQRALLEERETTKAFMSMAPTEGPALEQWQSQAQIAWLQKTNMDLMKKLEESTRLMDEKMKAMANMQFSGGGGGVRNTGLSYKEINEKLATIQAELFDENTPAQRQEELNIEYEKYIQELEQTPEYQKELEDQAEKWRQENEPINQQALRDVRLNLRGLGDQGCLELFKTKPELKLTLFTHDQIIKKHANDFNSLTTQALNEQEARALYAAMPKFRREQEKQVQWVNSLKEKIITEASKPKRPPPAPIAPKKKVAIKKPPAGKAAGGGGDFLAELLAKRERKD